MKSLHVLILGAGIAGLHCAQKLSRNSGEGLRITLVDQSEFHVLKADLYEVATAFNKEITEECMVRLRSTVATPTRSLIDPRRVQFIRDEVRSFDPKKKTVCLRNGPVLHYDYLVLALGSVTNFFDVPGIERHAFPLKTVQDALRINCRLDHIFHECWAGRSSSSFIDIVIGGGGPTGVEMASELYFSLKKLCKKYDHPRGKVRVRLIQSGQDLGGLDSDGSTKILEHLEEMGVQVYRGFRISEVLKDRVQVMDSSNKVSSLPSTVLIWTAGVKVHPLVAQFFGEKEKDGAVPVGKNLESLYFPKVFAAGDDAYLENPEQPGVRVPMLAREAWRQGECVAKNIRRDIAHHPFLSYCPGKTWLLLPLGGKYALLKAGPFLIRGFFVWFLRRLIILRYHLSTMSFTRAFEKWRKGGRIFHEND